VNGLRGKEKARIIIVVSEASRPESLFTGLFITRVQSLGYDSARFRNQFLDYIGFCASSSEKGKIIQKDQPFLIYSTFFIYTMNERGKFRTST